MNPWVRGLSCELNNQLNVLYDFGNSGWGWARKTSSSPQVIHYWPSQGGSSVLVLGCLFLVLEFRWRFTLCVFKLFLVHLRLQSGQLLRKNCSLGCPYVLFVFWLFVILVISRSGFEGGIWVLIAPVHGHCILVTVRKRLCLSCNSNPSFSKRYNELLDLYQLIETIQLIFISFLVSVDGIVHAATLSVVVKV